MSIKIPLRYPGAKSKLYDYICKLLIETANRCTFTNHSLAVLPYHCYFCQVISKAVLNELDPLGI